MTFLTLISLLVVIGCGQTGRMNSETRIFFLPDGKQIMLPERFVADSGSGRLVPIDDLLLCYGRRTWNIGGNQTVYEAIAIAPREAFSDSEAFRLQAAHYLQDADWRGPARRNLKWRKEEISNLTLRVAELEEVPNRWVIEVAESEASIYAIAFVTGRFRERSMVALLGIFRGEIPKSQNTP